MGEDESGEVEGNEDLDKDMWGEEKEKENEPQEFDDNQTDTEHSKDQNMEEPEAFDLPENMYLDDKEAEDNFEEAAANEPEKMPDFEDEEEDEEDKDDTGDDEVRTEIENLAEMDEK